MRSDDVTPDPAPVARVRDPELLRRLHIEWRACAICGESGGKLSLHHVHKHPRDDVRANLVMLCGSGTTGCHGEVELIPGGYARLVLQSHIRRSRPDTFEYLTVKLGGPIQADEWLRRYVS